MTPTERARHARKPRRCDLLRRYAKARGVTYETAERAFRFMGTPTEDFIESLEPVTPGARASQVEASRPVSDAGSGGLTPRPAVWPASRRVGA